MDRNVIPIQTRDNFFNEIKQINIKAIIYQIFENAEENTYIKYVLNNMQFMLYFNAKARQVLNLLL